MVESRCKPTLTMMRTTQVLVLWAEKLSCTHKRQHIKYDAHHELFTPLIFFQRTLSITSFTTNKTKIELLYLYFKSIFFITRDDVVSQRLKFGSAFLSYFWRSKMALFFNFPVSRVRPEKFCNFYWL